jgi:Domain of unknown function (DUF4263)
MTFQTSEEALRWLRPMAQKMTGPQHALAKLAKIKISRNTPKLVAAALLRVALREDLELHPRLEGNTLYEESVAELGEKDFDFSDSSTQEERSARRAHAYILGRIAAHKKLRLIRGDVVLLADEKPAEVSSIGKDGRVYFKGGEGFGAWPDRIKKVIRRDDASSGAKRLRVAAENEASKRSKKRAWSQARATELEKWFVSNSIQEAQVQAFENVIDDAVDERPIQKFIAQNPEILTSLVGGNERYCIPLKRLGERFVPDFVLGGVDSLGVRWHFVELETPRSGIYIGKGDGLDKFARKGSDQITAWRKWVADNLSRARDRRSDGGLGLFDIEGHAPGYVFVGRRDRMPNPVSESIRLEQRNRNNTEIHNYDWLLERLRGTLRYSGLPAMSPYLLSYDNESG